MKPMLKILDDADDFELNLVLTDQHVSKKFGNTIEEVEKDFSVAAVVDMKQVDDTAVSRSSALGECMIGMSRVFKTLKPDVCILYGDRGEVLSTAQVATMFNVPILHLQGGDLSGSTDEQVRHAITKLSHLHCPSNMQSYNRIIGMGEEKWRVKVVGDNHVDLIVAGEFKGEECVRKEFDLDISKPIFVVLQHSETTAPELSYYQMSETLKAIDRKNTKL